MKLLVFILFLVGSVLAETAIEAFDRANLDSVRAYLENVPKIRVFFGNSPSMGHQNNTYNLMLYLRQIGYKGNFEIVFDDRANSYLQNGELDLSTPKKLKYFFPDFSPESTNIQELDGGKITMIPESVFNKNKDRWEKVEFGFTGGDDYSALDARKMKAKGFLDLYPTEFSGLHPERMTLAEPYVFTDLTPYNWHEIPFQIPKDLEAVIQSIKNPDEATKAVVKLMQSTVPRDFMPVYGLKGYHNLRGSGFAIQRFSNLVKNVYDATKVTQGTVNNLTSSILVLNQLSEDEKKELTDEFKLKHPDIRVVDLTKPGTSSIENARKGVKEVVVYIVGGLPPSLFNYLLATSRLPPVGGGANFEQVMAQLKRPYLHTQKNSLPIIGAPESWIERKLGSLVILKTEKRDLRDKVDSAWHELQNGSSNGRLFDFVLSCLHKDQDTIELFKINTIKRPNKLLSALADMIQKMVHFGVISDPTQRTSPTLDSDKISACQKFYN